VRNSLICGKRRTPLENLSRGPWMQSARIKAQHTAGSGGREETETEAIHSTSLVAWEALDRGFELGALVKWGP
jgi:hypothetical protein